MTIFIRNGMAALLIGALPQTSREVPSALLLRANDPPMSFVASLVEARIPAGIEIRGSDIHLGPTRPSDVAATPTAPVATLIKAFNDHHSDYTAVLVDGIVVIRPTRRRVAYLEQPAPGERLEGRGLMMVTKRLFSPLNPAFSRVGGVGVATLVPSASTSTVATVWTSRSILAGAARWAF